MPRKHAFDPIAPTTLPGEPTDPKIHTEEEPERDAREETDEERQARESEQAFDRAVTRTPPG
jgi:hypothetical protein